MSNVKNSTSRVHLRVTKTSSLGRCATSLGKPSPLLNNERRLLHNNTLVHLCSIVPDTPRTSNIIIYNII